MTAQTVTITWQVTTVEEYSAQIPADALTVAALPEAVSFPDARVEHLVAFLAEREGSQHGYLTSEITDRTVTSVTIGDPVPEVPIEVDQFAGDIPVA